MAAAAWHSTVIGRRTCAPEIYIAKRIDNSRLVKVADPGRKQEMLHLTIALAVLFALVIGYAWQHFSAIEYGYRIEALRSQRDSLGELNRALRLEEASLRDPERIDALAQQMGLVAPQAGQIIRMDSGDDRDPGGPVMAKVSVVLPQY
ncbi:MAG TPA: cell division protein FtsL [Terriglobales bacterium]|nr:cell division protein FtsL [Terriglobales bacterium]